MPSRHRLQHAAQEAAITPGLVLCTARHCVDDIREHLKKGGHKERGKDVREQRDRERESDGHAARHISSITINRLFTHRCFNAHYQTLGTIKPSRRLPFTQTQTSVESVGFGCCPFQHYPNSYSLYMCSLTAKEKKQPLHAGPQRRWGLKDSRDHNKVVCRSLGFSAGARARRNGRSRRRR